ncbi:HNH endonuclease [Spiroplasma endosymbiont of Nebria brevicollis]|uniref:HNH endonuclease n=1 Tax=Spiroplasma endosymbiont of Nebria brevicollis TaxID=3066284 RepID=UPI003CC7A4B3
MNISLPILIASHIKPFSQCSNNFEKADNNNGILINPLHDSLFGKGYISFDESGILILSERIKNENWVNDGWITNRFLEKKIRYSRCYNFNYSCNYKYSCLFYTNIWWNLWSSNWI